MNALPVEQGAPNASALIEYSIRGLKIELTSRRAYWNGKLLRMGPKSFLFLHTLAFRLHKQEHPVVGQDELIRVLYGDDTDVWPASNTLSVFLNRLRNALVDAGSNFKIETIHNKGYQLILPQK